MLALPAALEAAIAAQLRVHRVEQWIADAQALSARYRAERRGGEEPLAHSARDALAYAAVIMPATYAQLHGALSATAVRAPHWQPGSVLDIGSGPGTALWAAAAQYPGLSRAVAWEREPTLIALGRELAAASDHPALRTAEWRRVDLEQAAGADTAATDSHRTAGRSRRSEERVLWTEEQGPWHADLARLAAADRPPPTDHRRSKNQRSASSVVNQTAVQQFDLVILGHVLNELPEALRPAVVDLAWRLTAGVLLIVEPGTSAAFPVVRAARDALLTAGARTLAPCPHDTPCPLAKDWCHFPQRLERPEFQRRARAAPSPWEDAKYSYAAVARFAPDAPIGGRVIREPVWNKAYTEALVCAPDGVAPLRALKRDREAFRRVKDLRWGEALEPEG